MPITAVAWAIVSPPGAVSALATPKSVTSACPRDSMMFSGLMSPCTIPAPCASSSAPATSRAIPRLSSTSSRRSRRIRSRRLFPLDERHRVEGQPAGRARAQHRDDVGMLQPGGDENLAAEALLRDAGRELGRQHLHRDAAAQGLVDGDEHPRHPPLQLALDRVGAAERAAQRGHRLVGHLSILPSPPCRMRPQTAGTCAGDDCWR